MNLNKKALEAAWSAVSGKGYHHLEPLVEAAISTYLSALVPADVSALVERLEADVTEQRTHGEPIDGTIVAEAASLIQSQAARIAELEAGLRTTRTLVSEAALTGFNCHEGKWAEQLYANQAAISKMVDLPRRTLQTKDRQP